MPFVLSLLPSLRESHIFCVDLVEQKLPVGSESAGSFFVLDTTNLEWIFKKTSTYAGEVHVKSLSRRALRVQSDEAVPQEEFLSFKKS